MVIRMLKSLLIASALVACLFSTVVAEEVRPTVIVVPEVKIRGANITLGDIANIIYEGEDKATRIVELREIPLGEAPTPKGRLTLAGAKIIQAIEDAGIKRESIGYSIPHTVVVERLGRSIDAAELLPVVRDKLAAEADYDLQVREVVLKNGQVVPVGESEYEVQILGKPQGGKIPVRVAAYVEKEPAARFLATAIVDDWREVPVLKRNIERGMLISADDVELVRLNLFNQPRDVASDTEEVVGRRVKTRLRAGDVVRKTTIDIPPTITRGKQVTMTFQKGIFKATALGQALDDGLEGEFIRLKNVDSKKVLRAKIVSKDEVIVVGQ